MTYEQIMKETFRLISKLKDFDEMNVGVVVYLGKEEWQLLHDYHVDLLGISVEKENARVYGHPTRFVDARSHLGVGLEVYL